MASNGEDNLLEKIDLPTNLDPKLDFSAKTKLFRQAERLEDNEIYSSISTPPVRDLSIPVFGLPKDSQEVDYESQSSEEEDNYQSGEDRYPNSVQEVMDMIKEESIPVTSKLINKITSIYHARKPRYSIYEWGIYIQGIKMSETMKTTQVLDSLTNDLNLITTAQKSTATAMQQVVKTLENNMRIMTTTLNKGKREIAPQVITDPLYQESTTGSSKKITFSSIPSTSTPAAGSSKIRPVVTDFKGKKVELTRDPLQIFEEKYSFALRPYIKKEAQDAALRYHMNDILKIKNRSEAEQVVLDLLRKYNKAPFRPNE